MALKLARRRTDQHPTLQAGAPMPPMQRIPEQVDMVGRNTGTRYSTLGDDPDSPEVVTVRSSHPSRKIVFNDGARSYITGGTMLVGPTDPVLTSYLRTMDLNNARRGGLMAQGNYLDAVGGVNRAQQQTYGPAFQRFGARQNYLNAVGGYNAAEAGTIAPRLGVVNAQEQQNNARRGYAIAAGNQLNTEVGQAQGIQRAQSNVPDLIAVARANRARAAENEQRGTYGMAALGEVDLPSGANTPLPAGFAPVLHSQADRLSTDAGNQQQVAHLQLQQAQNVVDLLGTNTQAAQIAADRAGITVEQAQALVRNAQQGTNQADLNYDISNFGVEQARDTASNAQLQQNAANLGVSWAEQQLREAGQPPQAGMEPYIDPNTLQGRWVTPAQLADLKAEDQRNEGNRQGASLFTHGELAGVPTSTLQLMVATGTLTQGIFFNEIVRRLMEQGVPLNIAQQQAGAFLTQATSRGNSGGGHGVDNG